MGLRRRATLIYTPWRSFAVAPDRESPLTRRTSVSGTLREQSPECSPYADLGPGDLVKVDCAAVALLTPEFLLRLGLSPQVEVLDLKERVRCRGCGPRGRAVVSVKWARQSG